MKHWNRILAALLASLMLCALPLTAMAELEIVGDDGIALDWEDDWEAPKLNPAAGLELSQLSGLQASDQASVGEASAALANDGDEDFELDENGVLVGYRGPGGDIVIPDDVTGIAGWVFSEFDALTGVTIPGSVKSIGEGAFQKCPKLTSVKLAKGVEEIGMRAFSECPKLKNLTIPSSVTNISYYAFYRCTGLTEVTIPGSVKTLVDGSFEECTGLVSLTLKKGVTEIEWQAFKGCTGLKNVTIPSSLTELSGFEGCTGLKSITIPGTVENISDKAFYECTGLASVKIEKGVKRISDCAFGWCTSLKSLMISEGVKEICSETFRGCSSLKSFAIPASVTWIEGDAFTACYSLEKFTVAAGNAKYASQDGVLYSKNMKTLMCCPAAKTSVTIPDGVKTIGSNSFEDCAHLKSVVIPNGVKSIGDSAFWACMRLQRVTIPASVKKIGEEAFCYEDDDEETRLLNVTIIAQPDSYAERYAKKEGISVLLDLGKAKITVGDQAYTGKALKPRVRVMLNGKRLKEGSDYKVAYKNNKAIGTASVIVEGKGGYTGSATGTFDIIPKAVTGLELTADKRRLTANWKKAGGVDGYQLQYSVKKDFSSVKQTTVAGAAVTQKVLKKLKSGKTYYVRIRAYKAVNGKKYWSAWSAAKKAKVK